MGGGPGQVAGPEIIAWRRKRQEGSERRRACDCKKLFPAAAIPAGRHAAGASDAIPQRQSDSHTVTLNLSTSTKSDSVLYSLVRLPLEIALEIKLGGAPTEIGAENLGYKPSNLVYKSLPKINDFC